MSARLDLKEFIHRQAVLKFYKSVLRDVKKLPIKQQSDLLDYIRHEFRVNAPSLDGNKYVLSKGKLQYETVKRSLGL